MTFDRELSRKQRHGFAAVLLPCMIGFVLVTGRVDSSAQTAAPHAPGLSVAFTSRGGDSSREGTVSPNVRLYVPAGDAPSPFLPKDPFTAVWEGFLSLDFRGHYQFEAEVNGTFQLELNGETVLDLNGPDGAPGKSIRLNRGANAFKANFASPASGDAFVRLSWIPRNSFSRPVPDAALSHQPGGAELETAEKLRRGRALLVEHQCLKCHEGPKKGMRELAMDAPGFEGIGARLNFDWMNRWILDPKSLRPDALMPKLLHGSRAKEDAVAMAAFLSSHGGGFHSPNKQVEVALIEPGKNLFVALQCAACHDSPELREGSPGKISLRHVRQKFAPGALAEFLRVPEAHYAWTRMPRYNLSAPEFGQLAAYLLASADREEEAARVSDPAILERGKQLVQTSGCLNCHSLGLENHFRAKPLAQLPPERWIHGCVAERRPENSAAPEFGFSDEDREALRLFARTDRQSLERDVPVEFAARQMQRLNCGECHGQRHDFPPLEILGAQLKPEWTKAFLSGEIPDKPRPWLDAKMPAFPAYAEGLARGLAMEHGYPPHTPAEPPVDSEAVTIGRQLVSASAGFACVSCHGVGSFRTPTVTEGMGVNLAQSGARLQRDFFVRWLRQPALIDPQTKMPVYFDEEGRSPLAAVLEGSADQQIEALWHYIRLGEKMPAPDE
jgi:mono/diheme cytochrome c family protein